MPLFKYFRERDEEHRGAGDRRGDVARGFGKKHRLRAEQRGQNERAAEIDDGLARKGKNDGILRLTERGQTVHKSVLERERSLVYN